MKLTCWKSLSTGGTVCAISVVTLMMALRDVPTAICIGGKFGFVRMLAGNLALDQLVKIHVN
jgi:hypothetical protein